MSKKRRMRSRSSAALRTSVSDLVGQRERPAYRMCPYCGRPCAGAACQAHRDLLALDPAMSPPVNDRSAGHHPPQVKRPTLQEVQV